MHRPLPLLELVNSLLPSPLITLQPLQPDRPASTYQLSYTKFHQQRLSSQLSSTQTNQLLQQIEQLKDELHKSKTITKRNESSYHQKLLLMSMQVQRVRTIMQEQGHTIDKAKHEWAQLESVYMYKLEEIKIHMARQFQQQIKAKSQQSSTIIEQVRQLYIEKIAAITQNYEKQLKQKEHQASNQQQHHVMLQISQMKEQQLQARVKLLAREHQRMERENQRMGRENQRVARENQRMERELFMAKKQLQDEKAHHSLNSPFGISGMTVTPHCNNRISRPAKMQQDHEQTMKLNDLLSTEIQSLRSHMKQTSFRLQQELSRLQQEKQSKEEQLEMMRWKYHKLEQELDEFKNRKTASNIPETNSQNKKTLFINNLRAEKEEQPRRQTQQRISYQQSLKKLHELELKVDQLTTELLKKDELIEQQADQLDQKTLQVNSFKKTLVQKDNTIKQLMQQLAELSRKDKDLAAQSSKNPAAQSSKNPAAQTSKNPAAQTSKKQTLALIQKEQLILSLKQQLQKRQSAIARLQKDLQKSSRRERQVQQKLTETQSTYTSRLKSKDNQIKAIESEIKLMESELRVKDNQLKSKESLIKALEAQLRQAKFKESQAREKQPQTREKPFDSKELKAKETELKAKQTQLKAKQTQLKLMNEQLKQMNEQLKHLSDQNTSLKDQLKSKLLELQQHQQLTKFYQDQITAKNQQLHLKEQQITKLSPNTHSFQPQPIRKRPQTKNPKLDQIQDPFADPFINTDDNDTINDPRDRPIQNPQHIQAKLHSYQHKITELQSLVHSLQLDWGHTEQNQNAIFTYLQATYQDQIHNLRAKLHQKQTLINQQQQFLTEMAKKGFSVNQELTASKAKAKPKK